MRLRQGNPHRMTDITLLRRFSQVLAIPPQAFGLTPPGGSRAGRHAVESKDGDARARWPRVSREPRWEDGEDPVRRRELLAGAAGLVGAATFGLPSVGRSRTSADPAAGLEDMLYHSTANAEPVPLAALRTAVTRVRADFQNARYDRMAASLPALIAAATAARLGSDANHRFTAFGPSGVILYQVSVAQVLGDSGTAIQYARKLRPAVITTAERQGRRLADCSTLCPAPCQAPGVGVGPERPG